jgi:hypothetical protein
MTLASRPAVADFCSHSGAMSGNTSRPGGVASCSGFNSGFYKYNEHVWNQTACNPGKCNAVTQQYSGCRDYDHIQYKDLRDQRNNMPGDRYWSYMNWARWDSNTGRYDWPNPIVDPTTLGQVLGGCGLQLSNPDKTMMQLYWDSYGEPDSLLAEACTAFLNVDFVGPEAFGYDASRLRYFIDSWTGSLLGLRDALHYLNNRGS